MNAAVQQQQYLLRAGTQCRHAMHVAMMCLPSGSILRHSRLWQLVADDEYGLWNGGSERMRALHARYGAINVAARGERYVGRVWPVLLSPCCCMCGYRKDLITASESAAAAR